jgi:hypothetical protein
MSVLLVLIYKKNILMGAFFIKTNKGELYLKCYVEKKSFTELKKEKCGTGMKNLQISLDLDPQH